MAGTVDVRASLDDFSRVLAAGSDAERCRDILALLWRWQRDPDLDESSLEHAKQLLRVYGPTYAVRM